MPTVEERLAALGLTVHEVIPPVAAYVPAVRTGNYVYTAGQLPFVDGKLTDTGKVGEEIIIMRRSGDSLHQKSHLLVHLVEAALLPIYEGVFIHRACVDMLYGLRELYVSLLGASLVCQEYAVIFSGEGVPEPVL